MYGTQALSGNSTKSCDNMGLLFIAVRNVRSFTSSSSVTNIVNPRSTVAVGVAEDDAIVTVVLNDFFSFIFGDLTPTSRHTRVLCTGYLLLLQEAVK